MPPGWARAEGSPLPAPPFSSLSECRKDVSTPSPAKIPPLLALDLAGTQDTIISKAAKESLRITSPWFLHNYIDFLLFWKPVSFREEAEAPSLLAEPFEKEQGVQRPRISRRGTPALTRPGHSHLGPMRPCLGPEIRRERNLSFQDHQVHFGPQAMCQDK